MSEPTSHNTVRPSDVCRTCGEELRRPVHGQPSTIRHLDGYPCGRLNADSAIAVAAEGEEDGNA